MEKPGGEVAEERASIGRDVRAGVPPGSLVRVDRLLTAGVLPGVAMVDEVAPVTPEMLAYLAGRRGGKATAHRAMFEHAADCYEARALMGVL